MVESCKNCIFENNMGNYDRIRRLWKLPMELDGREDVADECDKRTTN